MIYSLSSKLKAYRLFVKMTQQAVADALDVDRSTYSYYETGKTEPSVETLYRIAKLFNTSVDVLVDPNISFSEGSLHLQDDCNFEILTANEKKLIAKYRMLDNINKQEILNSLDKLTESN